ncbi:helix-turn-helix domain-containing protein [Bradyrhizobium sp. SYSU BS000235]|uniref:helix-turn-helix domain-containing protein n=1 Tax=Bradyrhizobium sp. SYSU BS000235 TaxID=3411332 RepID=UPI003C712E0C
MTDKPTSLLAEAHKAAKARQARIEEAAKRVPGYVPKPTFVNRAAVDPHPLPVPVLDVTFSIREIQREVTDHFGMTFADLVARRRDKKTTRSRQIALYLSKKLTVQSLPEIGRRFGGFDHTTVLHANKRIAAKLPFDSELAKDVATIEAKLLASKGGA